MTGAPNDNDGHSDGLTSGLEIHLESVTVSEVKILLPKVGVTAVVGGNNVGKSTFLREINGWLSHDPSGSVAPVRHVVQSVDIHRLGDDNALRKWLDGNAHMVMEPQPGYVSLHSNQPLSPEIASYYWQQETLGRLGPFFAHYSLALNRAEMVEPVGQRADIANPPQHPLHVLQDNPELLKEIDQVSRRVFRRPLTLDRLSGEAVLRVGEPSVTAPPVDSITAEYRQALGDLPRLNIQGDGMRSLLGLLLPVVSATYPIVLIDEPEAFLHPPQAYQLGKTLATIAKERGIQVLLATHDRNLLAGLLAAETDVSVVRLDREGDDTSAYQLSADEVRELWTDPVMRYSNVLEGLFHRMVVVAEADSDCKFYAAAIDAIDAHEPLSIPPSEVLFVPSGGKDGMAKIVTALRAARVRVVACPDLDLLDDPAKVKKLVKAFDGDWGDFEDDHTKAVQNLKAAHVEATCGQVLAQIEATLSDISNAAWTEETRALIKPALRTRQSDFKNLKRFGMATFSGQAAVHAEALINKLDALGICCVREGELERLAPTVGVSKGAAWLPAALGASAHHGEAARKQVQRLLTTGQGSTVP